MSILELLHFIDQGAAAFLVLDQPAEQGFAFLVAVKQSHDLLKVAFQRPQIGLHKTDRVVDFMGHSGRQLADRSQLLGLHQLLLGLFQFGVQRRQLVEALQQFGFGGLAAGDVLLQFPRCFTQLFAARGDQCFQFALGLEHFRFGKALFGEILQRLDCPDQAAVGIGQRCRGKIQPLAAFAEMRKKILGFVGSVDELRARQALVAIHLADPCFHAAIDNQVGHGQAFLAIEHFLVIPRAHHVGRLEADHLFAGLVPVRDQVFVVDDEGRHRIAVDNLRQFLLRMHMLCLGMFALGIVEVTGNGNHPAVDLDRRGQQDPASVPLPVP